MANNKNNINDSGLRKLCSFITLAATQGNIIDDLNIATDKTSSSKHIKDLIDNMSAEDRKYVDDIVANLNKLSSKTTNVVPDASNVEANTLYLYNADLSTATSFEQYMVLSDKTILPLGNTNISLVDYMKTSDADNKFATKQSLKDVTDKIGDTTQLETSTIMGDLESVKNKPTMIKLHKAEYETLVSTGSVTTDDGRNLTYSSEAFYILDDDNGETVDMSQYVKGTIATSIDSSSTNSQVASAKAVETRVNKVNKCTVHSNEDLNSITEPGLYACVGGDTYGSTHNFPIADNGYLQHIVYPADNYCMQTFVPNGVWGGELNMYVRRQVGGTWSSWQRLCGTTVQDSSGTGTMSDGATGNVSYKVKNGVAYVSVHNLAEGLTGNQACTITGLPKADGYVNIGIEKLGNRVGTIYTDDGTTFYVHKASTDAGYASFSYPVAEN